MDNIGDWLYYIVILIVAGISWINNSAKKQREQEKNTPPSAPREMRTTPPSPVPPQRKKKPRVSKQATRPAVSSLTASGEGERMIETFSEEEEKEKEIVLSEELALTDVDAFRKAILYAEILNRKY